MSHLRDPRPKETLLVYYEDSNNSFIVSVEVNGERKHFMVRRPLVDFHDLIFKRHIESLAKKLEYLEINADDIEAAITEECRLKCIPLKCLW